MDSEPTEAQCEALLEEYGITPAIARAWIEGTFKVTPEEIREGNPDGHGSHELETFVRIALGDKDRYLVEEVFREVREEVEERAREHAHRRGFDDWHPAVTAETWTDHRRKRLREDSKRMRQEYAQAS